MKEISHLYLWTGIEFIVQTLQLHLDISRNIIYHNFKLLLPIGINETYKQN